MRVWDRYKGSIKISLLAILLASVLFAVYVRVAFFFYINSDLIQFRTIQRQMYIFSDPEPYIYLIVFSFIVAIIPGVIGGFILNFFSLKDLERKILKYKNSILRGIIFGLLCGLLISIGMFPDELLRVENWKLYNHFIFLSGFMVSLIGAITGGVLGFFVHSCNLRKRLE